MTTSKYKTLIKKLATKYKLEGWEIYFGDCYFDTIAACNKGKKAMWFNKFFFSRLDLKFCKDTILHEIAHALVSKNTGHGRLWKDKCIEIGAIPLELSCWENESFRKRFYRMAMPDGPDSVVFPPEDKTKIMHI